MNMLKPGCLVLLAVCRLGAPLSSAFAQNPANVTQLIRDSQSALAAENAAEAERLAKSAVDLDPAHPPAWRQYGLCLLRSGKAPDAVTALQRTVALDEKDATAWRGLGLACWQAKQQNEAVRALSAYLRLKPEDVSVWRDLATWLTQLERPDQAVAALERVVELKPEDASAWRDLGSQLSRLLRTDQAAAALERTVALRPDDASAWRDLATAQAKLGRHEQASAALQRVVKIKPDDASAWRDLAAELARLERHEQAVSALEQVVKVKPDDVSAWRDMATGLTRLERSDKALAALEQVTRLSPDDAAGWREYATGLIRLARYDEASAALGRAVKSNPGDASAWRELAVLHQRGGRIAEATKAFEQALAARPDDPVTRRDLGWVLWTQGRRDEAVARLTEAVEAGIESRDRVIFQVAARLSEENAGEAALAFLRKVNPDSPPSAIGLALAKAGRVKAAEPILLNAWQRGDQTAEVGLYLAYARAANGQFADIDKHLEPLLRAPAPLPPEQADLALETLRLGSTRPEAPALMSRLEAVLGQAELGGKRVTDILETSAEASRMRAENEQALKLYRRVLERDPERPCWTWAVLLAERLEGKTPDAWLDSLEKRLTSPVRLSGVKGLRAERRGQPEAAVPALRQSLALDPKQPLLRSLLFDCLLRAGQIAEARAEAAWFAKQVEAGDATLRSPLAEMLTRLDETAAALPHWQALRKANPDAAFYGLETASALYTLGRPDEAMDLLKKMAGTQPSRRVFELMAEIEAACAHTAQSVDWASRGLAIDPSPALLRYHAEGAEKLATNVPAALASARAFLKKDPGYVPMALLEGRMLEASATAKTNEVDAFYRTLLARNPAFAPALAALRERATLDGRIDDAVAYADRRAELLPDNADALRACASSLAQQDRFRRALKLLRPLAEEPADKAVPLLIYQSVARHPYPGRNSVDQISRHIKRLADDGVTFVNAFSQICPTQNIRRVMIILADPSPDVIEALDPVLQRHNARVVYAGNAATPAVTLEGVPLPERLAPALSSGRWQLASGGPGSLQRQPVNEAGVLGNPLTHPLLAGGSPESPEAFAQRLDQTLAAAARALQPRGERILVYPSGDFGQRSLDTATNTLALLRGAVSRHFTHAVYFDDCGFYLPGPRGDPLRIPARTVPPEWDEKALAAYLGAGHPLTRARLELARVLYWHGQHEKAHAAFAEAEGAGAEPRETLFNWGMNAERQGDLPTAREKLLAAQALDPEAERTARALARLEERRRTQATAFLYGWKDNEDRDHYRYGAYADAYVSERVRLGALADRDRWSTDGVGSEYGTRYGLRGLAYLWPQIWLEGQLWRLDMDDLDDHWGGEALLRLPNPLLSGHFYLVATREEIETVEALRKNIDANTYALRTYTRLADLFDLFANLSQIDRSDGNDTTMLEGRLLYRLHEWPYIGAGWRFRIADSDRDPPEYWAPEQLEQHQACISVRGAWKRLSYTASAEAGVSRDRDTDWGFCWGARGEANYFLTERFSLNAEVGYFETTDYDRTFGRIAVTGRF